MKRITLIILSLICTISAFSQKSVRDSLRVGNEAYRQQLYNAAESKYKAAMNINPMEKMAVYNLANTYFKQSKWDEAIKEYESYLNMEMESATNRGAALHNMGNAYLKKKDLKKAMEAYKESLRNNPSDDQTRYNLAVVQKILSDQDKKNNKDQNKDQDKDKKDQQDDKKKQDQKDKDKPHDQKDQEKDKPKPQQPHENQMSSDNIEQILKAMEQEEKATQQRVQDRKNQAKKILNSNNRRQNKDW